MKKYPSKEFLRNLFEYKDGQLFYIRNPNNINIGSRAGYNTISGYRAVTINWKSYQEHRIIWTLINGEIPPYLVIDHIDRNKLNNKIENLRLVTPTGNSLNRFTKTNVQKWSEEKWYARFYSDGKRNSRFFTSKEEAEQWISEEKNKIILDVGP